MNRRIIKALLLLALISFGSFVLSTAAFAETSCGDANTNLIDCDVGGTGMIYTVANTIINILTAAVGVLATIGIIWCGFLILTAKDELSRVATAKKHLLEIVLGIAVWGGFWVLLELLIPGGALTTLSAGVDSIEVSVADNIYVGESSALDVIVSPDDAKDKTYSVISDDTTVVTVTRNSVLCMKTGSTTINVISANGKTSSTTVTCTQKPKETTAGNSGASTNSSDNQVGTTPITSTSGLNSYNGMSYWLNVPDGATNNMPVVIFLHGSGEIGNTSGVRGLAQVDQMFSRSNFISIAPVASSYGWEDKTATIKTIIDQAVSDTRANPNRIYIMGFSMGGRGTFKMINNYTTFFRAAVIASNCPVGSEAGNLKNVPISMYLGTADDDYYYYNDCMTAIKSQVENLGGNISLHYLHGATHATTSSSLPYDDIFAWLLSH